MLQTNTDVLKLNVHFNTFVSCGSSFDFIQTVGN